MTPMNDPRAFLDRLSGGYQDSLILLAANHLGVFGPLARAERDAASLAADLECDPRALEQLLLALTGAGVLEQPSPGRFRLPDALQPLLDPAGTETIHSILDHHFHLLDRWVRLADVVRTGEPARGADEKRTGRSLRAFICGMRDISRRSSYEVAELLPELGRCHRLLDLGGGPATAAITFCRRWPGLRAVLFDLPDVVPIAAEEITAAGLDDRIATLPGDFLVDPLLPDGAAPYDAVYISNIIHSHDEDETRRLYARARDVMAPGGLLVVKDFFLDDDRARPAFGSRFAINMLVGTPGGKSYTWTETEADLAALGFTDIARREVAVNSGLVTARRGT
jgi:hypothetical protein